MKSPHDTTPVQTPNEPDATASKNVAGIDASHLTDDQHASLLAAVQAIVSLLLGLFFRK